MSTTIRPAHEEDPSEPAVASPGRRVSDITERTGAIEAVGHPVRLRVLRRLTEGPASVPELAEVAEVHENTVRAHVAVLEEGGLLVSEPRPATGPGRPGIQLRLTPEGERLDHDFLGLAELLAAVVGRSGTPPSQLREIGREWGRYLVGRPGSYDITERIPVVLRRLGFQAELVEGRVELSGCPCPVVAADQPELICRLASGVLDGVLGAAGARRAVGEESHDPARRRCHITLVDITASASDRD